MKMFVCDLDGTLLNEKHETDTKINSFLNSLQKKGYYFAIATGRNINGIKKNTGLWEAPIHIIALNGALILDPSRNVLFQQNVEPCFAERLIREFPEYPFEFITQDRVYTQMSRASFLENFKNRNIWENDWSKRTPQEFETYLAQYAFDSDIQKLSALKILKINCTEPNEERYKRLAYFLSENSDTVVNAPFEANVFEITHKDVNKGAAIKRILRHYHLTEDEVAVFGDGDNDIVMLRSFSHSYAMENASPLAKEAASEIIGSNKDYAVLDKISKLIK